MILDAAFRELVAEVVRAEVGSVVRAEIREHLRAAPVRFSGQRLSSEVMTVAEAASTLKVATTTVLEWIHTGALMAFKLPGGREYRIRRDELEKLSAALPSPAPVDSNDEADRILHEVRALRPLGG